MATKCAATQPTSRRPARPASERMPSPTQEYIIADGDDNGNRQAFNTEWYQDKGPFDEIKARADADAGDCECKKSGKNQDATKFGLRLHEGGKWRFRCNDQPGYAMCQPGGTHQKCGGGVCQ